MLLLVIGGAWLVVLLLVLGAARSGARADRESERDARSLGA
jgi:hypothetical protein